MAAALGGRTESAGTVWVAGCEVAGKEWLDGGREEGGGGATEVEAGRCAEDAGFGAGSGGSCGGGVLLRFLDLKQNREKGNEIVNEIY